MPIRDLCVRTLCFLFLMFARVCETKCFSDAFNEGFRIFPRAKVSAFGMGLCINSVVPLGNQLIDRSTFSNVEESKPAAPRVPAACLPVICEVVQADAKAKTNVGSNSGKTDA